MIATVAGLSLLESKQDHVADALDRLDLSGDLDAFYEEQVEKQAALNP